MRVGNLPVPEQQAKEMNRCASEERHKKVADIIRNSNKTPQRNPLTESIKEVSESVSNLGNFLHKVKKEMIIKN